MRRELPAGWTTAALSDCVLPVPSLNPADTPDTEFTYCDISAIDNEAGVVVAPKVLVGRDAPSRARQAVRAGDVLFSTVRPGLRAIARVPAVENPVASTGFCVLRPAEGVDGSLLRHLLRSHDFLQQVLPLQRGVSYPAVRDADVLGQLVPVPPAAEQTRIVAKLEELLSELDAGVAELKAAQAKLQHYRQSLLKAAVEGSLTAAWREANPAPEETGADLLARILRERRARWEAQQLAKFEAQGKAPPKGWRDKYPEPTAPATGVATLPNTWTWATLGQLTEFITSGSRGWADYYSDTGATFIRSQDINKDWLDLSDCAHVQPPGGSEGQRTRVEQDDLLLTITGANVGKSARVHVHLDEAYVSQHVALLRPVHRLMSEYLHLFLTANGGGRGQLNKAAYGAGKPGLNLGQVGSVAVPLPPAAEAAALVAAVAAAMSAVANQEAAISAALRQSTAQRQNLLRAAFAGQLVPQDPADEPASALLARIRAGRTADKRQGDPS